MFSKLLSVLLFILTISQAVMAQWTINHPHTTQNSHYLVASPAGSQQVFMFGNDLLQFNLSTKAWSIVEEYDLQKNFKNELTVSPTPDIYSGVHFISPDTALMVYRQDILRTVDGGKSWEIVKSLNTNPVEEATSAFFTDLHFPSSSIGYAIGTFEKIFKTEDGGLNWTELRWMPNTTPYRRLNEVIFKDEQEGFILGYEAEDIDLNLGEYKAFLLKTEDGGLSWKESNILAGTGISDHHFAKLSITEDNTLYLALINRNYILTRDKLLRSVDNGESWEEITLPGTFTPGMIIYDMHWFSAEEGLIVGTTSSLYAGRQIYRTSNGGDSWTAVNLPIWPYIGAQRNYALAVAFDGAQGVIVGAGGTLIYTNDKGISWESIVFPYPQVKDLSMVDAETGYAIGENGLILKKMGAFWDTLSPPIASHAYIDDFQHIEFADADRGVLLGVSKGVYQTDDQAASWKQLLINGDTTALDVAYHKNSLYVLSMIKREQLVLLERRDGESSWTSSVIAAQTPKGFQKGQLQYISDDLVFASHEDVLFQRNPAGNSWVQINTSQPGNFEDRFYFQDENIAYLSTGNKIWWTDNGGQSWSPGQLASEVLELAPLQINGFTSLGQEQMIAFAQIHATESRPARDVCFLSEDQGRNWSLLPIPFHQESPLNGVTAWDVADNHLWMGSSNGLIFQYTAEVPTPVIDLPSSPPLVLFPNPAHSSIRIKAFDFNIDTWRMYSSDGKEVSHWVEAEAQEFDISPLAPGVYFLQVNSQNGVHLGSFLKH